MLHSGSSDSAFTQRGAKPRVVEPKVRFFVVSKVGFGVSNVNSGMPKTFFFVPKVFFGTPRAIFEAGKAFFLEKKSFFLWRQIVFLGPKSVLWCQKFLGMPTVFFRAFIFFVGV